MTWTIILFNSLLRLDIYNTDGYSTSKEGSGFDLLQSIMVLRSHIHMVLRSHIHTVSFYGEACASFLAEVCTHVVNAWSSNDWRTLHLHCERCSLNDALVHNIHQGFTKRGIS